MLNNLQINEKRSGNPAGRTNVTPQFDNSDAKLFSMVLSEAEANVCDIDPEEVIELDVFLNYGVFK